MTEAEAPMAFEGFDPYYDPDELDQITVESILEQLPEQEETESFDEEQLTFDDQDFEHQEQVHEELEAAPENEAEEALEEIAEESIEEDLEEEFEMPKLEKLEDIPFYEDVEKLSVDEMLEELEETAFGRRVREAEAETSEPEKEIDIDFKIPTPTEEFFALADETEEKIDNSVYFKNDTDGDETLDATDITLMMALGGQNELSQTMGFERIRRAVNDYDEAPDSELEGKEIYGCDGVEYQNEEQHAQISDRYAKEKKKMMFQILGTGIFTFILLIYEIAGYLGAGFFGFLDPSAHRTIHVFTALQFLFFCAAFSYQKIAKSFKSLFRFSSATCFSALALFALNIINDTCIAFSSEISGYPKTFHSFSALLFLISLLCDFFALYSQSSAFEIISASGRKFVFEPYGRFKPTEDDPFEKESLIDKESYCVERTSFVGKYFSRTSEPSLQAEKQIISLLLGLAVSFFVMLMLVLFNKPFDTVLSGFMLSASVSFTAATVFGSDYAFLAASQMLAKIKTAIVGKASVRDYSSCDLVYFDDNDVFDKNSVRTKGLKLYDNNEIYRVLYNAQAVFSKIGGPLKPVFEFATTEMGHSKNVVVKMIASEGIIATVDDNTTVCMGTYSFMKSNKIYHKRSVLGEKDSSSDDGIMYIALNGVLSAKLYVTYKISRRFEKVLRQLSKYSVDVGIRSADPNVNRYWASKLIKTQAANVTVVKPAVKELDPYVRRSDSGIVSTESARSVVDGLVMCLKLFEFDRIITGIRFAAIALGGILSFVLVMFSKFGIIGLLLMLLYEFACVGASVLLTHLHLKK